MDVNWMLDSVFEDLPVGDRHHIALRLDGESSWTYQALRKRRDVYAAKLLEEGVSAGDRVGLLLLNSLEYVAAYFAIARIGAIAVRVNFRLTPPELAFILNDSDCRAVVLHSSRILQIEPIRCDLGVKTWLVVPDDATPMPSWSEQIPEPPNTVDIDSVRRPDMPDPLQLMYTSGTTGRPKGVLWSHQNAMWFGAMQIMKWGYTDAVVGMTTGPLYHAGAFEHMVLPALMSHGTGVILSSGGVDTGRIVNAIRRSRATDVLLYPFLLYELLRDQTVDDGDLATVKTILVGGDPVLPWALAELGRRFSHVQVQQGYGLTEAPLSTLLDTDDGHARSFSVGRPMPFVRIRVVDAVGRSAAPGAVGEVWIQSPAGATQYWRNEEATEQIFGGGWCRTGDLGRVTDDGFLVIAGRAKDMIRSGGENIYPVEVEQTLSAHPDVSAVAVVGVPDSKYLESVCAVVVPNRRNDVGDEEIRNRLDAYARERLASYKCPRHYKFVERLPVNASGKVLKARLREDYADIGSQLRYPEVASVEVDRKYC